MLTDRGLLFTVRTVFIMALLASSAHAQNIYKCAGASGKITFSDSPCADNKATESVYKKSGDKGNTIDISALCKGVDQKKLKKAGACRVMELCEQHGDTRICDFYCSEYTRLQETFPGAGLESGPTSKLCLSKTKRVRGANWVEVSERIFNIPTNETYVHYNVYYKCIDKNRKLAPDQKIMLCNADITRCRDNSLLINQQKPEYLQIDELASKNCQSAQR